MKKVAILINSLDRGGAERVVSRISFPLADQYDLYIILVNEKMQKYECAGQVIGLGLEEKKSRIAFAVDIIKGAKKLQKLSEKYDFDAVISFLDVPCLMNLLAKKRAKTILSIRCYLEIYKYLSYSSKIKYYLAKIFYRKADAIIAVSQAIKHEMIQDFQINEKKVSVIENPYNAEEIKRASNENIDADVQNFINKHQTIVSVGRITKPKGCRYLVQALKMVVERIPDAGMIILGTGEDEVYVKNLVEELNLKENVLFAGVQSNPFAYISKCEIFVSASTVEGFPNTLVEAMLCETAVISSDCKTGPREILCEYPYANTQISDVEYAKYGVLVPSILYKNESEKNKNKKITIMSNAICRVLSDDKLRKKYAVIGCRHAEKYNMESCLEKHKKIIEGK